MIDTDKAFEEWSKIRHKKVCQGCKYYRPLPTETIRVCHYILDTEEPRKTEPWLTGECDKYERR